jgi:PAS domain S-box-containing protein
MLKKLVSLSPQSISVYDAGGRFVWGNQAFLDLFEFAPPPEYSLFEDPILERAGLKAELLKIKEGHVVRAQSIWYNAREIRADLPDKPICIGGIAFPIFGESGQLEKVVCIVEDITRQKLAEQAWRSSDEKFRIICRSVTDVVWDWDIGSGRLDWFGEIDQMLGYSPGEFHRTIEAWEAVIHPDDHDRVTKVLDRHVVLNEPYDVEYRVVTRDRGIRHWRDRGLAVRDSQGKAVRMIGSCTDVTEQKKTERALRESEERFRGIFENSLIGIYRTTPDGRVLMANPTLVSMMGYSTSEELAALDLENPANFPIVPRSDFKERIEVDGRVVGLESIWLRKDRSRLFVRESARVVRDAQGNSLYYEGTVEDITEQKKAEARLRLLSSIVEQSTEGMAVSDLEGNVLFLNDAFAAMHGYKAEELVGKHLSICHTAEQMAAVEAANRKLRQTGEFSGEIWHVRRDGTVFPGFMKNSLRRDEAGQPIGMIATMRDITDYKLAEEAIRHSEEHFRSLIESAHDIILVHDEHGRVTYITPSFERILGYGPEEILGRDVLDTIYPGDRERIRSRVEEEIRNPGKAVPFEARVRSKDERWIFLEGTGRNLLDVAAVGGIVVNCRDVTERKSAERRLLADRAKLKSLASELSLAEERERRRIAVELHDQISQSLVFSKMKLEALYEKMVECGCQAELQEVSEMISNVIEQTRTLTFDLSSPILYELGFEDAVAEWLREQIEKRHGIKADFEDDGQPKPLDEDVRVLLFRNTRELLVNVAKHAKTDHVRVSIRRVNGQIVVSVEDRGVGFDVSEASSGSSKGGGFGLLSVRERLEQLGGRLEIDSKPGRGTRITMFAPLRSAKDAQGASR